MEREMSKREDLLRRIRGLMGMTTANGCTEAEAQLAAAHVDRLMGEYDINLSDLEVRDQTCDQIGVPTGTIDRHMVTETGAAIAAFTDTKWWRSHRDDGVYIMYFGCRTDIEIAEYLTYLFQRALERETAGVGLLDFRWQKMHAGQRMEARRSFGLGMAARLSERLTELKSKRDWTTEHATGRSLIVVKGAVVTEQYAKLNLNLHYRPGPDAARDAAAYRSGLQAGDRVTIQQGVAGGVGVPSKEIA